MTFSKAPKPSMTRRRRVGLGLLRFRLLAFLAVIGPGFITANVDNDPGGILTYSQAGAKYGYALLWTLIPDHYRPDRGAGNGRAHGRDHRQRASPT